MAALSAHSSRRQTLVYVAINLLAFPGLGTLLAKRRFGWVQTILMVTGFLLVMGFIGWFFVCVWRYLQGASWTEEQFRRQYAAYAWVWQAGAALCVAAWCWALASSLALLSAGHARHGRNESAGPSSGAAPPALP